MNVLRRLALTRSDFQGGPVFWVFLCGSIVFAARVAAGTSFRVAVIAALVSPIGGLWAGAMAAAFLKREREWIAFNVINLTVVGGLPNDGVWLLSFKYFFCYLAFLWLALLIRRQFAEGKGRPEAAGSPLWDAELDR